jgi:hypothetical protein
MSTPTHARSQLEEDGRSNPLPSPAIPAIALHDADATVDIQVAHTVTRVVPRSADVEEVAPSRSPPQMGALKPLLPHRSKFSVEVPVGVRPQDAVQEHVPDVHIHINRVELTAVTAPPLPRRTNPAQGKKPMSLDEYLQRRNGKVR